MTRTAATPPARKCAPCRRRPRYARELMDRQAFRSLLAEGPLLGDGGTGTSLDAAGVPADACFDELNRSRPEIVDAVHRAFAEAGSRFIETNTWGANRYKLDKHGLPDTVREL